MDMGYTSILVSGLGICICSTHAKWCVGLNQGKNNWCFEVATVNGRQFPLPYSLPMRFWMKGVRCRGWAAPLSPVKGIRYLVRAMFPLWADHKA